MKDDCFMRKWKLFVILIFCLLLSINAAFSENNNDWRDKVLLKLSQNGGLDNEDKFVEIIRELLYPKDSSTPPDNGEFIYYDYDLKNRKNDNKKFKKALMLYFKGIYYYSYDLYSKAFEETQKAVVLFKEIGANMYIFDSYMFSTVVSINIKDLKHAKELIGKAASWVDKIENDTARLDRTAILNWNYGKLYLETGELEKAKLHLDSARRLIEYLQNLNCIYQVKWNYQIVFETLSKYFEMKGELDSALEMFHEIRKINEKQGIKQNEYNSPEVICRIYLKKKDYRKVIDTINYHFKAVQSLDENVLKLYLPKAKLALYDELAEAYYQLGDYEHSYQIQKELNQIYAQTMLEYKPLDAISAKLDMEHKLREEQLQQQMTNITFGAIILIILLSALIYYQRYRKTRKLNRQLYELNEIKNRLFRIISHDLRGPILSINQLIASIHTKFDKMNEETKLNLLNDIYFSSNKVVNLLENLLQWSQFQIKSRNNIKEEIFVRDAIQEVLEQVDYLTKSKHIEIHLNCLNCDKISMNKNEFEVLIRNLLTNSLKFSDDGGKIEIRGQKTNGATTIEIVDNGIGMSDEARKLILDSSKNYQRKGNKGEKGSGLGLMIVKDILERNHGNIELNPNFPQGLIVKIELVN